MARQARRGEFRARGALVFGAFGMGLSPVFVRYADVGPFTSAFYRVALSLPALWLWAAIEARNRAASPSAQPSDPGWTLATVLAGAFFAGDLFFWHLSIVKTTIAEATLLATMAPVWVALFSGLVIKEPVTRAMLMGLIVCLTGAAMLVGARWNGPSGGLIGDVYGFLTSIFFGFYFLAIRVARRETMSGLVLFRSTVVTTLCLAVVAGLLERDWLPVSIGGISALIALAFISHVGGQGLLAFALGTLSAAFSSLVIFLEALFAAFFGWVLFHESLTALQFAGSGAILLGVWIARPR
jgi:drug/metabolite transporter (DMT)-like permease